MGMSPHVNLQLSPASHTNEPPDGDNLNNSLPTFSEQLDPQWYDQDDINSDIQIDPSDGPIDYYQEALESLQNGDHKFFLCQSSSDELGIETEEGLTNEVELDNNNGAKSYCADESPFFINLPGMY